MMQSSFSLMLVSLPHQFGSGNREQEPACARA
jgi:hypothetical protein